MKTQRQPTTEQAPPATMDRPGSQSKKTAVLVAVSGGVDSSVAALLLKQQGFRVMGVTFQFAEGGGPGPLREHQPSTPSPVQRAAKTCARLGIRHEIIRLENQFHEAVVRPFVEEYGLGKTPNPCVRCNVHVKWPGLLALASSLGCAFVATGHYARVRHAEKRCELLRGVDPSKDQSYALYALSQDALRRTVFPLSEMHKEQVRRLAAHAGLCTSGVRESQDICFISHGDYRLFLAQRLPLEPGPILNTAGQILGVHQGLPLYTIGQRRGLGIAEGSRLYVIRKDVEKNTLVVGPRSDLCRQSFLVTGVNWVSVEEPRSGTTLKAEVEVRYRTKPLPAEIRVLCPDKVRIHVPKHELAITPGQSAVWYQGELLLGGGTIEA